MIRTYAMAVTALALSTAVAATSPRPEPPVAGTDRIVVVGDLDGDLELLAETLVGADVIDGDGTWIGGGVRVVLLGNALPTRGPAGTALATVRRLAERAASAGGALHLVLGGHEIDAALAPASCRGLDPDDRRWLASRPALLVLDRTAFAHGGLSPALADALAAGLEPGSDPEFVALSGAVGRLAETGGRTPCGPPLTLLGEIGAIARDAGPGTPRARHAAEVLERTGAWVLRADGPVFFTGLSTDPEADLAAPLERALKILGVRRLVVARVPTPGRRIVSRFEGRLVRVDTDAARSGPGYLEIAGDALHAVHPREARPGALRRQSPGRARLYSQATAEDDTALEKFLRDAEIVGDEEIGTGITKPRRLTLRRDGAERRAAFKFVDQRIDRMVRLHDRMELAFTDRYVYEVAAYRIDRLLGIGAVPVTVLREIDGREGAVQVWVEDSVNERDRRAEGLEPDDPTLLARQRTLMNVFDALIYNTDRNQTNILYTRADWKLWLIDHSRAFRLKTGRPPALERVPIALSPDMRARLEALTEASLRKALGRMLSRAQVRALLKRRDRLLADR
ncbi:MAG: hypothetical protein Kow0062_12330 [Acidobacteriota bacterium]